MMQRPLTRVLLERERLRSRMEAQRQDARRYAAGLAGPAAVIDGVRQAGAFVRSHPHVVVASVAAVFVLRARTMLGLLTPALGVWRMARSAQALLRHVRA